MRILHFIIGKGNKHRSNGVNQVISEFVNIQLNMELMLGLLVTLVMLRSKVKLSAKMVLK